MREIDALAAAHVEHPQSSSFGVPELVLHPVGVPLARVEQPLKVRARARLSLRDARTARICRPLLDRGPLVVRSEFVHPESPLFGRSQQSTSGVVLAQERKACRNPRWIAQQMRQNDR
jgi:hypothetical protein